MKKKKKNDGSTFLDAARQRCQRLRTISVLPLFISIDKPTHRKFLMEHI